MSKQPSKVNELLAAINRQVPPVPVVSAQSLPASEVTPDQQRAEGELPSGAKVEPGAKRSKRQPANSSKARVGQQVQFWLHDEDRRTVRELAAWLAGQGERPTDSVIIRSALKMVTAGGDLLKVYRQVSSLDGRFKQQKTRESI